MRYKFSSRSAFTLVEVLVASTILAFATFGLLGLLRLSDQMAFRARADGKAAQIFKSRTLSLASLPVSYFRHLVLYGGDGNGFTKSSLSGGWLFERGSLSGEAVATNIFPLGEVEDPTQPVFLFKTRPLPGQTDLRLVFPYKESVELSFFSDFEGVGGVSVPSLARSMRIIYVLSWRDSFADQDRVLRFEFLKNDV